MFETTYDFSVSAVKLQVLDIIFLANHYLENYILIGLYVSNYKIKLLGNM